MFLNEVIKRVKKNFKKCSSFLVSREMQIRTTPIFHLIPIRIAKIFLAGNK